MIKDNGIHNFEDFDDEDVNGLKFGTLYSQEQNAFLQLPLHFFKKVIDTNEPCKFSRQQIIDLIQEISYHVTNDQPDDLNQLKFCYLYLSREDQLIKTTHFSLNGVLRKQDFKEFKEMSGSIALKQEEYEYEIMYGANYVTQLSIEGDDSISIDEFYINPFTN